LDWILSNIQSHSCTYNGRDGRGGEEVHVIDIRIYASDPDAERRKAKYDRKLIKKGWDPAVVELMPAPLPWFHLPHHHQAWQVAYKALQDLNRLSDSERAAALEMVAELNAQKVQHCPCCGQVIPL